MVYLLQMVDLSDLSMAMLVYQRVDAIDQGGWDYQNLLNFPSTVMEALVDRVDLSQGVAGDPATKMVDSINRYARDWELKHQQLGFIQLNECGVKQPRKGGMNSNTNKNLSTKEQGTLTNPKKD